MSAEIHNIRDYQSKRAIERAHKELEKEAAKILTPFVETESFGGTHPLVPYVETVGFTETIPHEINPHTRHIFLEKAPYGGKGIDGMDLGPERA